VVSLDFPTIWQVFECRAFVQGHNYCAIFVMLVMFELIVIENVFAWPNVNALITKAQAGH
jgi:hypothetical protein